MSFKLRHVLIAILTVLAMAFAAACSDGGPECDQDNPCANPEVCAFVGPDLDDSKCVKTCVDDTQCDGRDECTGTASSCPFCQDIFSYCK